MILLDLLTNCESELLKNESLFSDESLLSEFEEPMPIDTDAFDFLDLNTNDEFKDSNIPVPASNENLVLPQSPVDILPVQNVPSKVPVASTPTVFSSQYALPQNINFNVQPSVVTLAPMAQQGQLLLPAKLIKSESVVYSKRSPAIPTAPVSHRIHTLVNTANGTVLATGEY